ncbi:MAG: primosomal protein N' [Bacteroidaceae bacterium]
MKRYVDVILPLPLAQRFTYVLSDEISEQVQIGCRVVVPFGQKKFYTAIVCRIHQHAPEGYEVKEVQSLLDDSPILVSQQFRIWQWIADYYLCTEGDVYKSALPAGLKLESETFVECKAGVEVEVQLSKSEQRVLSLLTDSPVQSVKNLEKDSGIKNIFPVIKSLLDKGAIILKENLRTTYKPKVEIHVRLTSEMRDKARLHQVLGEIERAPKQFTLLMKYIDLSGLLNGGALNEVSKKELLVKSGISLSVFSALEVKHVFETYDYVIGRLGTSHLSAVVDSKELNEYQQCAYDEILQRFKEKNVCLLYGVTSSGKTEIYIHLIEEMIRQGKQVLYLLPEIALTTQITTRLQQVFGTHLGVYHSKFSDSERVEIWQKQLSTHPYDVILGVRSSVFLPFRNLGLVIVDEEHENSYKQQEPAPRYHARNVAIVLASMYGAKTLLGTATPSVESWYNATTGKYGLVCLKERFKNIQLPEIIPVDIKELKRKKRMNGLFSPLLMSCMHEALENKEQVILFQNRRGFSQMVECKTCGWVPKCQNCDVSLTYHKSTHQLTCHYCGCTYDVPKVCPACGETDLMNRGFGTERVEDEIKCCFPEAKVSRMDLDTTRTRSAFEKIIADFEQSKTDILIGTQMVSKGLDFDHVSVVGILNADSMFNYPDFRAYERAFQLMEQVAGRAGRKNKRGRVILQTHDIENPIISQVINNDFDGMVNELLAERKLFHYPPYYRLIYVYLKYRNEALLDKAALMMADKLRAVFGDRVLGPDKPPVGRVRMLYIKKMVIKIEQDASMSLARERLLSIQKEMLNNDCPRSISIFYDVDPM